MKHLVPALAAAVLTTTLATAPSPAPAAADPCRPLLDNIVSNGIQQNGIADEHTFPNGVSPNGSSLDGIEVARGGGDKPGTGGTDPKRRSNLKRGSSLAGIEVAAVTGGTGDKPEPTPTPKRQSNLKRGASLDEVGGTGMDATGQLLAFVMRLNKASPK